VTAGAQDWRYDFDEEVGARLREWRVARGLTLRELGGAVGLSKQQISLFENGRNRMNAGVLAVICVTLNVSADTLLGIDLPPDEPPAPPPPM
jgi:transcriptional regulator with XRE-family HTH domain